jgi:hypothetical protein
MTATPSATLERLSQNVLAISGRCAVVRGLWFWAAYLMTIDRRGVSALLLQRQLGLTCYGPHG